jgi:hypothetical protein
LLVEFILASGEQALERLVFRLLLGTVVQELAASALKPLVLYP